MGTTDTTTDTPLFDIELELRGPSELAEGELEARGELCLEELHSSFSFIAFGPVVAIDLDDNIIELSFKVAADSPEQMHETVGRVASRLAETLDSFEYQGSRMSRQVKVPA